MSNEPDCGEGWKYVSYAVVQSLVLSAEGTEDPLGPHHWGSAAPGCL